MRAARHRRRDVVRSPTRSSACWRRRGSNRACLRSRASGDSTMELRRNSATVLVLRRLAVPFVLVAALIAPAGAGAGAQPSLRSVAAVTLKQHVRHGKVAIPAGHNRSLVTVIVDLPL